MSDPCPSCDPTKVATKLLKVLVGADKASPQAQRDRLNKCLAPCPHLLDSKMPALQRCDLCKCFLRAKTKLASEQCPDNPPRWLVEKA